MVGTTDIRARALWWVVGALLAAAGCGDKVFYLPGAGTGVGAWPQEGRTPDGRAFAEQNMDPPLQLLWQQELDAAPLGGMLFTDHLVLQLTAAPTLYAFDRRSGKPLGKRGTDIQICTSPALVGEVLIYAELGRKPGLRAFDCRTGKVRWRYAGAVCAPLVARRDTVVVAGESGKLSALRVGDGQELWCQQTGALLRTAPALAGDQLYLGAADGSCRAFGLGSGAERWSHALEGGVRTRVVAGRDRVFVGTAAGVVYAIDAGSGDLVWKTPLGTLPAPGMALTPDVLVVGGADRRIYGLESASGAVRWRFETGGVVRAAPAAAAGTVFCGSSDGHLYALETATGRLQWKYRLDGAATSPVALGRDMVGISSENQTAYVFGRL